MQGKKSLFCRYHGCLTVLSHILVFKLWPDYIFSLLNDVHHLFLDQQDMILQPSYTALYRAFYRVDSEGNEGVIFSTVALLDPYTVPSMHYQHEGFRV